MTRKESMSWLGIAVAVTLTACSTQRTAQTVSRPVPTLADLGHVPVLEGRERDKRLANDPRHVAIGEYRVLSTLPQAEPLRAEALRRAADLTLDDIQPDIQPAIELYRKRLQLYPDRPDNDEVLYQLAHALDQAGRNDEAAQTLRILLQRHPQSRHRLEAWFRLGEHDFVRGKYARAQRAYERITGQGRKSSFYLRALYKQGWCQLRLGDSEAAVISFLRLLDQTTVEGANRIEGLDPGRKELVTDTLRGLFLATTTTGHDDYTLELVEKRPDHAWIIERLGHYYLEKGRFQDAARTYRHFLERHPWSPASPRFASRLIEAYRAGGFSTLLRQARLDYIERFAPGGAYWKHQNPADHEDVAGKVRDYLMTEAKRWHALSRKQQENSARKNASKRAMAAYRRYLDGYPDDPSAFEAGYLLAGLLMEQKLYAEAAAAYEDIAYDMASAKGNPGRPDAGYRALLAYQALRRPRPDDRESGRHHLDSALRFIQSFPDHPDLDQVLLATAELAYQLGDRDDAIEQSRRLLAHATDLKPAQRLSALALLGQSYFDTERYEDAAKAFREALNVDHLEQKDHSDLLARLAASYYRMGQRAREEGRTEAAVDYFRQAASPGVKTVSPVASFDLAAILIERKEWPEAIATLENHLDSFPDDERVPEVLRRLAHAYEKNGDHGQAGKAYRRMAQISTNDEIGRQALWQAAEMFALANDIEAENRAWKKYIKQYPEPREDRLDAMNRLAEHYARRHDRRRYYWLKRLAGSIDPEDGKATVHMRELAGRASLGMVDEVCAQYTRLRIVRPLKKSLRIKQRKMRECIRGYEKAASYSIADISAEASYRIAEIQRDLATAILESERPANLDREALEEYAILLEDLAYPFEQMAVSIHELNLARLARGIDNEWIWRSLDALRELLPQRYAKLERGEVFHVQAEN